MHHSFEGFSSGKGVKVAGGAAAAPSTSSSQAAAAAPAASKATAGQQLKLAFYVQPVLPDKEAACNQNVFADDDDSNSDDDDELDLFGEMTEEEKEAKAKKDAVSLHFFFWHLSILPILA